MIYHAATSVAIVRIKELVSHGWDVLVSSQLLAPACMPFLAHGSLSALWAHVISSFLASFWLMHACLFLAHVFFPAPWAHAMSFSSHLMSHACNPFFGTCLAFSSPLGSCHFFLASFWLMHLVHMLAYGFFPAHWAYVISFFQPSLGSCMYAIFLAHAFFFQPIGLMSFPLSSQLLAQACMLFFYIFFQPFGLMSFLFLQPALGTCMDAIVWHILLLALWAHVFLLCSPFGLMFACCLHACLVFQPTLLAHFCFASPSWLMLLCHFQVLFFCNSFSFIHS